MNIKYLITSDWHLREDPGSRKQTRDEFISTQVDKIKNVFSIAVKHSCRAIIHGGDFFDSPKVSFAFFNIIAKTFNSMPNGLTMHVIPGNHDLIGYNLSTLEYSPLTTLSYVTNRIKLQTTGAAIPYTTNHDKNLYNIPEKIIVTHNSVFHKVMPFPVILTEDLAPICKNKIVICGHIHRKFSDYHRNNNALFLNPGPLIRTDISESGIVPSVIILELSNDLIKPYFDFMTIPDTLSGSNLFDLEAYNALKDKESDINKFIDKVKNVDLRDYSWEDMIYNLAKLEGIPIEVAQEAARRLKFRNYGLINASI